MAFQQNEIQRIKSRHYDPTDDTTLADFRPAGSMIAFDNAVVTDNKDPDSMGRVKVSFPHWHKNAVTGWIPVVRPYAGDNQGMFFLPDPGDEVICGFEGGNPDKPVVIGSVYKKKEPDIAGELGKGLMKAADNMKKSFGEEATTLMKTSLTTIVKTGTKMLTTLVSSKLKSLNVGKLAEFLKALSDFGSGLLGALKGGIPALMQGAAAKAGVKQPDEESSEAEKMKNEAMQAAFKMAEESCGEVMNMLGDMLGAVGSSISDGSSDGDEDKKEDDSKTEDSGQGGGDIKSKTGEMAKEMGQTLVKSAKESGMKLLNQAKDMGLKLLKDFKKALVGIGYKLLADMVLGDSCKNFTMLTSKSGMRIIMQEIDGFEQISLLMCPTGIGAFAAILRFLTNTADIQIHLNKTLGMLITNDVGEIRFRCKTFNMKAMIPPLFLTAKEFTINGQQINWKSLLSLMLASQEKDAEINASQVDFYTRLVLAKGKMMATMMDMAVGIDIHNVEVPTNTGMKTVPIPHPYAGMLMDKLSKDVRIAGLFAATKGSKSKFTTPGHIAMAPGVKFTSQPNNEGEITSGTEPTVLVNKKEAAVMMSKVTTCNDMGLRDHCQVVLGGAMSLLNMVTGGQESEDGGGGAGGGGGGNGPGPGMQPAAVGGKLTWQKIQSGIKTFTQALQQVQQICRELGIPLDDWLGKLMIFSPVMKMIYISERFAPSIERCVVAYIFTKALSDVSNSGVMTIKDNTGKVLLEKEIALFDPIEMSQYKSKEEVKERMFQMLKDGLWDGKDKDGRYVSPTQSPFKISLHVKDKPEVKEEKETKVEIDRIVTNVYNSGSLSVRRGVNSSSLASTTAEARVFLKSMFGFGLLTMVPLQVKFNFSTPVSNISGSVGLGYNVSNKLKETYKDNKTASAALDFSPDIKVGGSLDNPFGDVNPGPVTSFEACTLTALGPDLANAKVFFSRPESDLKVQATVIGQGNESFIDFQGITKDDIAGLIWDNTSGLRDLIREGLDEAIGALERALGIDFPFDGKFLMEKLKWLTDEGLKKFIEYLKNAKLDWKTVDFNKIDWERMKLEMQKNIVQNSPIRHGVTPDASYNWDRIDWNGVWGANNVFDSSREDRDRDRDRDRKKKEKVKKRISQLKWMKDGVIIRSATYEEDIKLTAMATNFNEGDPVTVRIYEKDYKSEDDLLKTFFGQVKDGRIELDWRVTYIEDKDDLGSNIEQKMRNFTLPEYVFEIKADGTKRRSNLLRLEGKLTIKVIDKETKRPVVDKPFIIRKEGQEVYRGKLNALGQVVIRHLKPDHYDFELVADDYKLNV